MFKLLIKLCILVLILSVLYCGVIYFAPYSKKFAYNYKAVTNESYNKIGWVHERLKQPIDYAFIGSSHTLVGVDDGYIQKTVRDIADKDSIYVTNLGRTWPGRNLDYLFIKDLLEQQEPSIIFLEVTERIPFGGHLFFPILANKYELFDTVNLSNLKLGRDIHTAFISRLDSLVASIFNIESIYDHRYFFKDHGCLAQEGKFDGKIESVSERNLLLKKHLPSIHKLIVEKNLNFYNYYMNKIIKLAEEKNVQVILLYIPRYNPPHLPDEYNLWEGKYTYWVPPMDIFRNAENFSDCYHLNPKGGNLLSAWIAEKIIKEL